MNAWYNKAISNMTAGCHRIACTSTIEFSLLWVSQQSSVSIQQTKFNCQQQKDITRETHKQFSCPLALLQLSPRSHSWKLSCSSSRASETATRQVTNKLKQVRTLATSSWLLVSQAQTNRRNSSMKMITFSNLRSKKKGESIGRSGKTEGQWVKGTETQSTH